MIYFLKFIVVLTTLSLGQYNDNLNGKIFYWKNDSSTHAFTKSQSIIEFKNDSIHIIDLPYHPSGFINYYTSQYQYNTGNNELNLIFKEMTRHSGNTGFMSTLSGEFKIKLRINGNQIIRVGESGIINFDKNGDIIPESTVMEYRHKEKLELKLTETWKYRLKMFEKVYSLYIKPHK